MKVIGLMSGSSLDGLDVALCQFNKQPNGLLNWEILEAKTFDFPKWLATNLATAPRLNVVQLYDLDVAMAKFSAQCIKQLSLWQSADAIASHGHTVLHEPKKGYSLQICNAWILAAETQKTVIADFRNADIALGGQGAPLVPKADIDLFADYDACLNLGGIANATIKNEGNVEAFDICACNQWLNALSQNIGYKYDEDGKLSAKGILIQDVLTIYEQWGYINKPAPKSLSNQDCVDFFTKNIAPLSPKFKTEDLLYTTLVFIANCIKKELQSANKILLSGGGAFNKTLVKALKEELNIDLASKRLINFKEALAFAYLGYCKLSGLNSNIPSATGARKFCQLGNVYKI